jgi:hypothetical protein
MRNYLTCILLILLSLSTSALSEEKVVLLTTGESGDIVQVQTVPTDMEKLLNSYTESYEEIAIPPEDMNSVAIYTKEFSSDNPPYIPAVSYDGGYISYVDSDWIEAQGINAFGKGMHFLELDDNHVFDCQGLLKRMSHLASAGLGQKKASEAMNTVANDSDPLSCRSVLNSAGREIRCCTETSKEALDDSAMSPRGMLRLQGQLLNRIHLKAELSVLPALLLALKW